MEIAALLFDVNGTVVDIETDEGMEEVYRAIGHFLTYQGIRLHRGEVRELYFRVMKEQLAGSPEAYPEFDVVLVWKKILEEWASDYTRGLAAEKLRQLPLFLAEVQRGISRKRLRLFPKVPEVLEQLQLRYRLAIVSDAQSPYARPELRAVGIHAYFDPIIVSGDHGYRKPDARLFQKALESLRIGPEQAVFIGNDPYRDIFGARQVGMKTILFRSSQANGHPGEAEADYVIRDFSELPRALEYLAARA